MSAVATRKKASQQSPPPSAAAIERRRHEVSELHYEGRAELAAMWLARLQSVLVTPARIENEHGATEEVYKAVLTLSRRDGTEAGKLHRRLSQEIARELWDRGEVDPVRAEVLNALNEFAGYYYPPGHPFVPGWDSWEKRNPA